MNSIFTFSQPTALNGPRKDLSVINGGVIMSTSVARSAVGFGFAGKKIKVWPKLNLVKMPNFRLKPNPGFSFA